MLFKAGFDWPKTLQSGGVDKLQGLVSLWWEWVLFPNTYHPGYGINLLPLGLLSIHCKLFSHDHIHYLN